MKEINLFCLPFAGGNKYSYRPFERHVPPFVRLIPLEYPGRGARIRENFAGNMAELVDDLYKQVGHETDKKSYAFYGHSMGGVVAFYLLKKILAAQQNPPVHLFITGTMGPASIMHEQKKRHLMSKEAFIQEIKDLDGCPEEILQSDELLDYYEPILRADFQVSETFRYEPGEPLNIPLTVVTGTDEDMDDDDIRLWQQETTCAVDFRKMPGKHFFIFDHPAEIFSIIRSKLLLNQKIHQL